MAGTIPIQLIWRMLPFASRATIMRSRALYDPSLRKLFVTEFHCVSVPSQSFSCQVISSCKVQDEMTGTIPIKVSRRMLPFACRSNSVLACGES